ncbi:TniQ family protein [Agrobacterium genomosp. 3]|uniref:TniQ family protein n=1 Tax=Agrobacterium TaxID=357 RepID=UPI001152DA1F|nr:TniQ family protein [Agrobacterium tumefaciens]MCA1869423.1 TniQ family protein [Agrobacterium tomkonis]MCA2378812.1 TniQ family protein [Agrobacterium tomkonis RTP8]MCA1879810.1 TniQ family protein [Agrobacterium tumefaciens]MCA1894999.1 TniQ family protein [Agrobacterium tomkonis]TQN59270.1 TniQ family protein [Agrobacterium tumefaciens]
MTAVDRLGPAIGIRELYRDVVSEKWPVIVAPQHDELLSSWLHRLAYANGLAPRPFARVLGLHAGMWSASLDLKLPADAENLLRAHTGISPARLSAMMLTRSSLKPLLLPLRSTGRRAGSTWLQFCSHCLAEDAEPYFRRRWRLAIQVSCATHRCGLRDRCPSCHSRIEAFDQSELVPQHYCVHCGFDLRRASKVPMSPPAVRLDRCINDICRLEAITGSLRSGTLVQRLLRIPSVSDNFPTASLGSLSTSMRIRCVERLANRPTDWLTADEDAMAAHWRRSILLAGGHAPLIAKLADALEQKSQRRTTTIRRMPTAELSTLLGAYVRVMEGPPRRRSRKCRSTPSDGAQTRSEKGP